MLRITPEAPKGWQDASFESADQPVVGVNWFDAVAYCERLSKVKGELYRLPTEAEWEKRLPWWPFGWGMCMG